ncbi:hypothetical protein H6P81_005077 [Aristolochia fimbriata]|uniref:NmrA-like domain-containing protein n=1 Tax=Aristolochia fimbriata TaxID=158543 RepID=A0AAV7ETY5_ARIFI|nr:hypothetical protein H6P81_005077 [Aristolochia fimbriata]
MAREGNKSSARVLIIGGTGHMGRRMVRASLAMGHPTYVLFRDENLYDIEKVEMLLEFKREGATLLPGSWDNAGGRLTEAVKQVDVVISAVAGNHVRDAILDQLKLVEVMKEAGNIKRFIPSEFGMDPDRMANSLPPGNQLFKDKCKVRRAIEAAGIPHTYVSANCCAGYFLGGLGQIGALLPSPHRCTLYGDGTVKVVCNDEKDIATYVLKTVDDPRTLNKAIFIRPPANVLSQGEIVKIWEKLIGHELQKTYVTAEACFQSMEGKPFGIQMAIIHNYHIYYEGCLTNFELSEDEEASKLYPDVKYTTVEQYLKRYFNFLLGLSDKPMVPLGEKPTLKPKQKGRAHDPYAYPLSLSVGCFIRRGSETVGCCQSDIPRDTRRSGTLSRQHAKPCMRTPQCTCLPNLPSSSSAAAAAEVVPGGEGGDGGDSGGVHAGALGPDPGGDGGGAHPGDASSGDIQSGAGPGGDIRVSDRSRVSVLRRVRGGGAIGSLLDLQVRDGKAARGGRPAGARQNDSREQGQGDQGARRASCLGKYGWVASAGDRSELIVVKNIFGYIALIFS